LPFHQNRRREGTEPLAMLDARVQHILHVMSGRPGWATMERLPSARGPHSIRP
jgi:hypothetical protein